MPQFDFYVFNYFTLVFIAFAFAIGFVVLFSTALTVFLKVHVRALMKAGLLREMIDLGKMVSIILGNDLLEQFVLPGCGALATITVAVFAVIIFISAFTARVLTKVGYFVASVGVDIYHDNAVAFSRLWLYMVVFFVTVLSSNMIGILPVSYTLTSSAVAPFFFSLVLFGACVYIVISRFGLKAVAGFLPAGTDYNIAPLIIIIEFISAVAKFVSLGVRLFANMFAGHLLLKVFYTICFQLLTSAQLFFFFADVATAGFVVFITSLEIMIAILQSFVFVLLSIMYLKEAENFIAAH